MNQKTTIFYVDDDLDDLDVFREVITVFGHTPALFTDGYEMLARLEDSDPQNDIVFVDLNMPTISGYDLIRAIRRSEKFARVPVISYSTAKDISTVERARAAGADLHLPKAASYSEIKKSLEYVLNLDWKNFKADGSNFLYTGKPA